MDCTVSHSCSCRVNFGCGMSALLLRLIKRKKGQKMVSVSTQTDDDLIEVLVAKKWGERIRGQSIAMRVAPPPPPPERRPGVHHSHVQTNSKSVIGPFAPTLEELTKGLASLRPLKSVSETNSQCCVGGQEDCKTSKSSLVSHRPSASSPNKMSPEVSEISPGEKINTV